MLTNSESKLLYALKSRSGRDKHGMFVLEGVRLVEDALAAGIDLQFAVASPTLEDSRRGQALLEQLASRTQVRRVKDLKDIAETETPQGVVVVGKIPATTLDDVVIGESSLVLVLDAVQDPGNLGTLIRSADAFNASVVIALPGTVDYWNPKVIRSAAGATFHVPLINTGEDATWQWLRSHQFAVCGADMHGVDVSMASLGQRSALVVGNEGGGLRGNTRLHITKTLAIPMPGRAESLNVGVAAGILLYEMSKAIR